MKKQIVTTQGIAKNDFEETNEAKKNISVLTLEKNSFIDEGKGLIRFKNGLVITDDGEQRNGTKYDIKSMDISEYSGKLTADHSRSIQSIIGKVIGTRKVANRKVVIDAIQFAIKESALAIFAYDMLKGEYATDFSIETFGPWPNEDGVYENSKLIGLSLVVVGNNRSATTNELAMQSLERAKKLGLDTSLVENNYLMYDEVESQTHLNNKQGDQDMKFKTVKNSRGFAVTVSVKNDAGEMVELVIGKGQSIQVNEADAAAVEKQIDEATEPKVETPKDEKKDEPSAEVKEALAKVAEMSTKLNDLQKQVFDNGAQEPGFVKVNGANTKFKDLGYMDRHEQQINAFIAMKKGDAAAGKTLNELNAFHMAELKEKGIVPNSMTLADFGNFVISPELITEIQGKRSNFSPLLDKVTFRETLSLQMAYLTRSGDIDMQPVEKCDDGADGNLKPIKEYSATITTKDLEELAAVTPVCNAATRFLAADLLGDVAAGYRNDYDRKKAQLVVARLQQAVDSTGNIVNYDRTSATTSLTSFVKVLAKVQENVENGYFILNTKSKWQLVEDAIAAGISGPLAEMLMTGKLDPILGQNYIVVPNELLPTLNTAETKTYVVNGVSVTINQGMFYADLSTFTGRVSGGLQYDLSTEAAYEDGDTVKSAYQRNEVLLRGSFFRGGAIMDTSLVAGLRAPGIS